MLPNPLSTSVEINHTSSASSFVTPSKTIISTSYTTEVRSTATTPAAVSQTEIPVSSTSSRDKSGLSTGAKAGIGVAAGVSFIVLVLALIFFGGRRRRKAGWTSKGVNPRELYPEDGVNSAYALNGGYTESPIGTAITTENKAHLGPDGFVPGVREIYIDEEDQADHHQDPHTVVHTQDSRTYAHPNFQDSALPNPTTKRNSQLASPILRKEIGTFSPHPVYPPTLPKTIYTPSPTHSRSNSRMSGVLRGPVPDMYAFGGETIDNDEELERLEEEERRIDEAIQESERLDQMRAEREALRGKIEERKARLDGV
jgi:hypothetical protein